MPKAVRCSVAMVVATCLALTACQPGNPKDPRPATSDIFARPGGVNVGVRTDEPGFSELIPGSNVRSGFDVDLYGWLGSHVPPTFVPIPVDLTGEDRGEALRDRRVQLVVETYSITDERRKSVGFAGPYMLTREGVMVRADDKRIRTFDDLRGKAVCTLPASTSLDQLDALRNQITLTIETGFKGCVERLLKKQVDVVATDQLILIGYALKDPGHLMVVKDLTFGAQERYGVGLPHGDTAACNVITDKLREFITSGTWDQFFTTYFPGLDHAAHKPDPFKLDPCE